MKRLSPAGRATIVRDTTPAEDLANHLPRYLLKDMLFAIAKRLNVSSIRFQGQYGEVEGSPRDNVILSHYALTGTWSSKFQTEIIDRIFGTSGGGSFIDVGANIGLTTIPAAKNHPITCFALEPDPLNFKFLGRNIESNGLNEDKVKIYKLAAYSEEAHLDFELSPDNLGDHRIRENNSRILSPPLQQEDSRETITINAKPLDKILAEENLPHPIVIKVDTQGSEPKVFIGARNLLKKADCLVAEFSPYILARAGFTCDDFFSELHEFSYGYIISFDRVDYDLAKIATSPLTFEEVVEICRTRSANKHPDNYFDVLLVKKRDFFITAIPEEHGAS